MGSLPSDPPRPRLRKVGKPRHAPAFSRFICASTDHLIVSPHRAKKALEKLTLQAVEQEQYHGQILASIEVLRKQKISLRADPSVGLRSLNVKVRDIGGFFREGSEYIL